MVRHSLRVLLCFCQSQLLLLQLQLLLQQLNLLLLVEHGVRRTGRLHKHKVQLFLTWTVQAGNKHKGNTKNKSQVNAYAIQRADFQPPPHRVQEVQKIGPWDPFGCGGGRKIFFPKSSDSWRFVGISPKFNRQVGHFAEQSWKFTFARGTSEWNFVKFCNFAPCMHGIVGKSFSSWVDWCKKINM